MNEGTTINIGITATDEASVALQASADSVGALQAEIIDSTPSINAYADSLDRTAAAGEVATPAIETSGAAAADASGGFNLFNSSMLKTLAPLAALFLGFEGLKSIFTEAKTNTDLWNSSTGQINNTLKNTNDAVGLTITQLQKMADANAKGLPITASMNLAAENTLLTYKAIGKDVFPAASAQIANLATAMANTKGQTVANSEEMAQAAKLLGKGLEDPATGMTALSKVGVKFSADQVAAVKALETTKTVTEKLVPTLNSHGKMVEKLTKVTEKTTDVAAAQKLMMSDLADVVQGKASTSADTFSGKLAIIKKTMAEDLIPAIQKVEKILEDFGSAILAIGIFLDQHKVLLVAIGAVLGTVLAVAIWSVVASVIAWSIAMMPLIAAWITFNATMLIWIVAIAAVAVIAYEIITHWNDVKQWFMDFWSWIKHVFDDIVGYIKRNWELLGAILLAPVMPALLIWELFHKQITKIFDDALKDVENIWNAITGFFSGLSDGIKAIFDTIVGFIVHIFQDEWNGMVAIWNGIGNFFGSIVSTITNAVHGFRSLLYNAGKDLIQGLINGVTDMADKVKNVVGGVGKDVMHAFTDVTQIFSPSKVFMQYGQYLGEGLVQGIQGSNTAVTQASTQLGQSAITGVSSVPSLNTNNSPSTVSNISSTDASSNTSQNITIQNLIVQAPNGATIASIMASINQDTLNASKGLTVSQGSTA